MKTLRSSKKRIHSSTKKTFSKKDYEANDGMMTSVWGPAMWHYLHTMSFNYPTNPSIKDKMYYRNFVLNLQHVLPCKYCRINLVKNFKKMPLTMTHMKNRDSFSKYIYNLHELINKMLCKKSNLSFDDVRERYEHFRARCTQNMVSKMKENKTHKKKEKGCVEPLYGKKAKCVINIIPQDNKLDNIKVHKDCLKERIKGT